VFGWVHSTVVTLPPKTDRDSTWPNISKKSFTHFKQRDFDPSNLHRNTRHKQISAELFQERHDPRPDIGNGNGNGTDCKQTNTV
jgi:hypothetical protein